MAAGMQRLDVLGSLFALTSLVVASTARAQPAVEPAPTVPVGASPSAAEVVTPDAPNVAVAPAAPAETGCFPACREGYLCSAGQCIAYREPFAVCVEHLHAHDVAPGRDAGDRVVLLRYRLRVAALAPVPRHGTHDALRQLALELTGDDAGDVRPVTGPIAQGTLLTRRLRKRIVQREIVVLEPVTEGESSVDARIHDGPHDVIAQRGERAVRSVGFHRAHRFHEQRPDLEVRPDAEDRARARRRSLAGR